MDPDITLSPVAKRALTVHIAALEKAQHGLQAFLQGVAAALGIDADTHSFDMNRGVFVRNAAPDVASDTAPPAAGDTDAPASSNVRAVQETVTLLAPQHVPSHPSARSRRRDIKLEALAERLSGT